LCSHKAIASRSSRLSKEDQERTQQWQKAMQRDSRWPEMIFQPDHRPMSVEKLVAKVKSIYTSLTMSSSDDPRRDQI
jgi:hypothetical protein